MQALVAVGRFLERDRRTALLVCCAVVIGAGTVLLTFSPEFLAGGGPFWANPRGAWLMDPDDSIQSIDVLTAQVGYLAFLHAPWGLPLFFAPDLGAPEGSSVILVDAVPIVALIGKIWFTATGAVVNPYGVWVGLCFVLSAVFATLLMIALGQRSLLAAIAASLIAVSMPVLLFRFGHLSLMGQFMVIGALWLYARDLGIRRRWVRWAWWTGWLCVAALLHGYLFVMVSALYAATWLRRIDVQRPKLAAGLGEPLLIALCVGGELAIAGHFGKGTGTSPTAFGYGYFSMNLLSPVWPQRSGLFPGLWGLKIGPAGQFEGFNYLGAGVLALLIAGGALFHRAIPAALRRHRALAVVLVCLTAFAMSNAVFVGKLLVWYLPLPGPLAAAAGVFRSSGRVFWPCGYALALFGLAFVLRRLAPGWKSTVVIGCCLLQLIDTDPLRARLTRLTTQAVPTVLDTAAWQGRMAKAERVHVVPAFGCNPSSAAVLAGRRAGWDTYIVLMELQRLAMAAGRPIDSVNNPRRADDCAAAAAAMTRGPWDPHTLQVFVTGGLSGLPEGWRPPGLSCAAFSRGFWCLGAADDAK